jgi:hypothetical protein
VEVFRWYKNCFVGLIITSSLTSFHTSFHPSQPLDHSKNTALMRFSSAAAATVLALATTATASTQLSLFDAGLYLTSAGAAARTLKNKPKSTLDPVSRSNSQAVI